MTGKAGGATARKYVNFQVDIGIPNPSSGGFCPCALNYCAGKQPWDIIAVASNHHMEGQSARFDYIDMSVSLLIPTARIIAGYPGGP